MTSLFLRHEPLFAGCFLYLIAISPSWLGTPLFSQRAVKTSPKFPAISCFSLPTPPFSSHHAVNLYSSSQPSHADFSLFRRAYASQDQPSFGPSLQLAAYKRPLILVPNQEKHLVLDLKTRPANEPSVLGARSRFGVQAETERDF